MSARAPWGAVAHGRWVVAIAVFGLDKMGEDQAVFCAAEVKVAIPAESCGIHNRHISVCSGLVQGDWGIYTQHL